MKKGRGSRVEGHEELQKLIQQIEELTGALQRERADAVNLRRRYEEQIASLQTLGKASAVRELLPAIDNLERALKHAPSREDKKLLEWVSGVAKVQAQFEKILGQIGVQKIKAVGQPFSPHLHEAVSLEDAGGDQEIISEELQPGYILGGEVLRHAMVRVRLQGRSKSL